MTASTAPAAPAGSVLTLGALASIVGGELDGNNEVRALAYAIDSRVVSPGTVFFALPGERTDGHLFLDAVLVQGGAAAVVEAGRKAPAGLPLVRVADPKAALQSLGRHFRSAWPLSVIGITGSAGKTTTKEFTAALLASRRQVFKSEGNLNSAIGLPLTLTRRRPEEEIAVLELGMSFPGELRALSRLARPDVAAVTNVGLAHIGNFRSADEVAAAKAEILDGVSDGGVFVANADDPRVMAMHRRPALRLVTFAVQAPADVRALAIEPLGAEGTRLVVECAGKQGETVLPVVGAHQARNLLGALAVALGVGLDPLELLPVVPSLQALAHRGVLRRLGGVLLLDDCYNSSPAALFAALETLAHLPGERRVAILGDMLELGSFSEAAHREAGRRVARVASMLIGVGPESSALVEEARADGCRDVHHVPDARTAAEVATSLIRPGDAVLVKASRGIGLDLVADAIAKVLA